MDIVVTGATSFIGSAAVLQLLREGHCVICVVRPGSAGLVRLSALLRREAGRADGTPKTAQAGSAGRARVIELDARQIRRLPGCVKRADAWLHTVWEGAGSENRKNRGVQQGNIALSMEAVRTAAALGCGRFVFTGSQAEYGILHVPAREDLQTAPVSEYGRAKAAFGHQARGLCAGSGMAYIHSRIFSVYGPGDHPYALVPSCIRAFCAGGEMRLGACTQMWNYLYIEDAARALSCLLRAGAPGIYNVAGADTRPLREYIEELFKLCGGTGRFYYSTRGDNAEGAADLLPDISKICGETGWRPLVPFAEGIYETLHSLRAEADG